MQGLKRLTKGANALKGLIKRACNDDRQRLSSIELRSTRQSQLPHSKHVVHQGAPSWTQLHKSGLGWTSLGLPLTDEPDT